MPFDSDAGAFLVPGPSGASAYEAWRGLGNTGTVADFLATLVGAPGKDSQVAGPEGKQGPAGAGAVAVRTASTVIAAWTTVIADGPSNCVPADPTNPAHRGLVIGITAFGGASGASVEVQNTGDLSGPARGFAAESVLFVGANGALVASPPDNAAWRQTVATVVSDGHIVVALGEASLLDDGDEVMLDEGGFSTPCPLDRAADPAAGGYVTPAANARAFSAMLCGAVPADLPPRRGQFLLALEARQAGSIQSLVDALPSNPADPLNVAWFHIAGIVADGRLAQFAKTTLSLTDAQLAAVIASARLIIE